jgi:radical SAM protein with 4Fe4S-binding SPASM domain
MHIGKWLTFAPVFAKCLWKLPMKHLLYMAKQFRNENPHSHNGRVHINSFFPPYPSKAFDRFLEAIFNCWRVPFSTYFAVTDQCPYQCPHCSYGKHISGSLNTEQALEVIRQIKSIGSVTIGFTGGEPLVRDDIVELVKFVGDDTTSIIFSTGYNLTRELANDLNEAGLDCMTIGIESDDPEEHDSIRGVKGSYGTALSSIKISLEAGLYTAISTIGDREKLKNGTLERLAELATDYRVHEFRILEPIPTGSLSGQCEETLTAEESKQVAQFHKQWNRKNKGPAITSFAHLESDEMFGCGAGFHHLFIDALGNVCPCDLTPLKLGNVLEEPLSDIWERMSQWFDMPRCGCFMKKICTESNSLQNVTEFPLSREQSEELCTQLKNESELPKVFDNLFKDRKPTSPPVNQ